MGTFKRTQNPYALPRSAVRQFDGIGGPQTQVLRRTDVRGGDISNTVCNDIADLHLAERGSMRLRAGMRRLDSADYDIKWLGQIRIGGLLRYGMIYNNGLEIVDMPPKLGYRDLPFEFPEDDPAAPADYPSGWPMPDDVVDEIVPEDPSLPAEGQVCAVNYEWTDSPSALSFTMAYGGPVPSAQNWYWKCEGYRPALVSGVYNADPSWLDTTEDAHWAWDVGPCHGVQIARLTVAPNGKDAAGDWLAAGTYTFTKTLSLSDGNSLDVVIQLIVSPPDIALSPTSFSPSLPASATGNRTKTIAVTNNGAAGSVLAWGVTITGDAALTAIMSLDVTSGSLTSGQSENTVLTLTNPGALSAGTYTANIRFADTVLTTEYEDFTVTLIVTPAYTGNLVYSSSVQDNNIPPWSPNPKIIGPTTVSSSAGGAGYVRQWSTTPGWGPTVAFLGIRNDGGVDIKLTDVGYDTMTLYAGDGQSDLAFDVTTGAPTVSGLVVTGGGDEYALRVPTESWQVS